MPRELVGLDGFRKAFSALLEGLEDGNAQQSLLATGLHGVGKTVLLQDFVAVARKRRWAIIDIDAARRDDHGFRRQLSFEFRSVLLAISPRSRWKPKTVAASRVLGAFSSLLGKDSPLTPEWTESDKGSADTGSLSVDVTAMILALGEAAREHGTGVLLSIDNMHHLTIHQLGALIDGLHRTYLRELPITLVGAGLPRSDAIPTETQVRANRLFKFPVLDTLSNAAAAALLRGPLAWDEDAIDAALELTGRIPAFLQALGSAVWDETRGGSVSVALVEKVRAKYENTLDSKFFRGTVSRTNELNLPYLRAVVDSPVEAETARLLARTAQQCAETRAGLVEKGWLFLREDGSAAFAAPGFEDYLRRTMPTLVVPAHKQRRRRYDP